MNIRDTQRLIEKTIHDMDIYPTISQLSRALPQISLRDIKSILISLEQLNKIVFYKNKIIWIWNPKLTKILKEKGLIIH